MEVLTFKKGDRILNENEVIESIYIIEEGQVVCGYDYFVDNPRKHLAKIQKKAVHTLGPGEHIKEFESLILNHSPYNIDVTSNTCKVLALRRDHYFDVLDKN